MVSNILSGKNIAESIKSEVSADIARLKADHGITPMLAVVRVGDDPASAVYVGNKVKTSEAIGLISEHHHLPATVSRAELIGMVRALNWRDEVDGILVQLPLPDQINDREILELIDPDKDVDGFHPINVGRLSQGEKALVPCTPAGVIEILKRSGIEIAGQNAVIVGRSNIVGKPMGLPPQQGDKGLLITDASLGRSVDVLEVIDDANAIVRAWYIPSAGSEPMARDATFVDVWVRGVDAEKLSGQMPAMLTQTFHVIGNQLIDTTCGKRSFVVLEALR